MRTLSSFFLAQCTTQKEPYLRRKGSGQLFLPIHRTHEDLFQQRFPQWSQDWCAIMTKKNDNLMQQFIWDTINPKLLRAFADRGARDFSGTDWLRPIRKSQDEVRKLRGFQKILNLLSSNSRRHCWNNTCTWIDCAGCDSLRLDRGCSFNINSILENGLRARRDDRPSSSHLSTLSVKIQMKKEAPSDDFTIPRKVHHHSNWKHDQDAVHWVRLFRAQDQGLRFWQTISTAIIVHNPVPTDCICRVVLRPEIELVRKTLNPSTCAESEALGNRSSSNSHSLVVRLLAPRNWMRSELRIEVSKAI